MPPEEGMTSVSIQLPKAIHRRLKVYCAQHNVTLKDTLADLNLKSIKELLGDE